MSSGTTGTTKPTVKRDDAGPNLALIDFSLDGFVTAIASFAMRRAVDQYTGRPRWFGRLDDIDGVMNY